MSNKLSELVDNLFGIYKKRMHKMWGKKKNQISMSFKLNCDCKECRESSLIPINGLIKNFPNIYQFCNGDTDKFALLLRKIVYPSEYMDSWKRHYW